MPTKPKEEVVEEPKDKSQHQMMELLRRLFLASIGAAVVAQEEIETLVNKLVERGEIAEKDGKTLIHEMMDKRRTKTADVTVEINKNVENVLARMNIPTKADVEALGQKINALSRKVDDLKKPEETKKA
jgi:poly(hydroxyalkanoate) granule-associated protein